MAEWKSYLKEGSKLHHEDEICLDKFKRFLIFERSGEKDTIRRYRMSAINLHPADKILFEKFKNFLLSERSAETGLTNTERSPTRKQDCAGCKRSFPTRRMRKYDYCSCMACQECITARYRSMVKNKQAWEFCCPFCHNPDVLENKSKKEEFFKTFQHKTAHLLSPGEASDLNKKIREWMDKKDDEFLWCPSCGRGLFVNELGDELKCTKCDQVPPQLQKQLKECCICGENYKMDKIQILFYCQCYTCTDCFKEYFKQAIKGQSLAGFRCPQCRGPDLLDAAVAREHFWFLEAMLKEMVSPEEQSILSMKIRDWFLQKNEKFIWCSNPQCEHGFIYEGDMKATCPKCKKQTCPRCKSPWEGHENRTCAQFKVYKELLSAKGALEVLSHCKIYCPNCKAVFALERGGCQHLTCRQCKYEFCEGCGQHFGLCEKYEDCKLKGLHAHHPRTCSYYLRDGRYETERLQNLLVDHGVDFDTTTDGQQDTCPIEVVLEASGPLNFMKYPCEEPVEVNQAGVCRGHYKEYLIKEINRHRLDPLEIMDESEMLMVIDRAHHGRPTQKDRQTLMQYIKDNLEIYTGM